MKPSSASQVGDKISYSGINVNQKQLPDMEISKRLKQLLKAKGIRQTELAERASIAQSSVSRYVNGVQEPQLHELHAISKVLGVSMDSWFTVFNGADETRARPKPPPPAVEKSRAANENTKRKLKKIRSAVLKIYKDMGELEK